MVLDMVEWTITNQVEGFVRLTFFQSNGSEIPLLGISDWQNEGDQICLSNYHIV